MGAFCPSSPYRHAWPQRCSSAVQVTLCVLAVHTDSGGCPVVWQLQRACHAMPCQQVWACWIGAPLLAGLRSLSLLPAKSKDKVEPVSSSLERSTQKPA